MAPVLLLQVGVVAGGIFSAAHGSGQENDRKEADCQAEQGHFRDFHRDQFQEKIVKKGGGKLQKIFPSPGRPEDWADFIDSH